MDKESFNIVNLIMRDASISGKDYGAETDHYLTYVCGSPEPFLPMLFESHTESLAICHPDIEKCSRISPYHLVDGVDANKSCLWPYESLLKAEGAFPVNLKPVHYGTKYRRSFRGSQPQLSGTGPVIRRVASIETVTEWVSLLHNYRLPKLVPPLTLVCL